MMHVIHSNHHLAMMFAVFLNNPLSAHMCQLRHKSPSKVFSFSSQKSLQNRLKSMSTTNNFSIQFFHCFWDPKHSRKWIQKQVKFNKKSSRTPKGPPKCPQDVPRRAQDALPRLPQTYQEAPRRLQKVPQTRPKPCKIWQEARCCQEGFKYHIFPFQFVMKNNNMTSLTSHVDRDYYRDIQKDQMHTGKDFEIQCQHVADKQQHRSNATACTTQHKCTLNTTLTHLMSTCC